MSAITMKRSERSPSARICAVILALALVAAPHLATADASPGYSGWDKDSPYNLLYNVKERDTLKGVLQGFEKITPLTGMDPGMALILEDGGERIVVHLCPWQFASPEETGLRKGDKIKVSGSWAMVNDQEVFMAAKVKWGENSEIKVRLTSDGSPFWTMTPEELEREGGDPLGRKK